MVWTWAKGQALENLDRPPIVEVVCGVHFDPLDVDPVLVGAFWSQKRSDYPHREIHPALQPAADPAGVMVIGSGMPLRTWMISEDSTRLIQIQRDRFYLNWRRQPQGGEYPRFSSSGERGILAQVLREFESFRHFCVQVLGNAPVVRRVELGKVDHFAEGESWNDFQDLAQMIPSLGPMLSLCEGRSDVVWRIQDRKGDAEFSLSAASTLTFQAGIPTPRRGLKVETSVVLPAATGDLEAKYRVANGTVNAAFDMLVPVSERQRRFRTSPVPK